MSESYLIRPVAHIYTDFQERFGIPRQAGLATSAVGRIIFEPEFRDVNAIRGISAFSHLWLLWSFSETRLDMTQQPVRWTATVTPPRLGGKTRMGVFATRSPYRPNSLGLSCVKLLSVDAEGKDAPVLTVGGADILDGTAVFDIKPYLPYTDCHPEASDGFAVTSTDAVKVEFPEALLLTIPEPKRKALLDILRQDPRGSYEKAPGYVYGLHFADYDIRFTVADGTLTVFDVRPYDETLSKIKN